MSKLYVNRGSNKDNQLMSQEFNIDNGAGTTVDELVGYMTDQATPVRAFLVYTEASDSGDASGANVKVGTSVGGAQIVAATNLENGKAINSTTSLTLAVDKIAAGSAIWVRHTGIAATQVGKYRLFIDYHVDA